MLEKEVIMQVARLMRKRLSSPVASLCRGPHVPSPSFQILENGGDLIKGAQRGPCIYRLFSPTIFGRDAHLGALKHFQPAVQITSRKHQIQTVLGLTFATCCLARWSGHAEIVMCEEGQGGKAIPAPLKLSVVKVEENNKGSRFVVVLKYLWVPTLVFLTIATGYQFPSSLAISLVILLWSTKPTPSSIYAWVEKRRLQEAVDKRGFEKYGDNSKESSGDGESSSSVFSLRTLSSLWAWQLNPTATVMHVEVRDYSLFCLARVTSMTRNTTMVGILGGWWVIYSSSSTITALGLRSLLPTPPPILKKYLDKLDTDMLSEMEN